MKLWLFCGLLLLNCGEGHVHQHDPINQNPKVDLLMDQLWSLQTPFQEELTTGKDWLILIYFDENACSSCLKDTLKILANSYEQYQNGFDFVLVSQNLDAGPLRGYRKARMAPFPVALDPDRKLGIQVPFLIALVRSGEFRPVLSYQPDMAHDLAANIKRFFQLARNA